MLSPCGLTGCRPTSRCPLPKSIKSANIRRHVGDWFYDKGYRPTTGTRYRDRLALKAEDDGWTGFTTKLVKTLLFSRPRVKAPPAWAVLYFYRADWHVNFSGCWYDGSRVRIPESAAIIP